ncbi:MAG TPA: hypothetical protein VJN67_20030 [Stellaceae bacterium]|nr:hypothetical protein [Stellaceae bacterium]
MGAFSGFLIVAGVMVLFGSAMSLGLTFLHTMQGDSWAPVRTGSFLSSYIGVDLGVGRLFDWLGWGILYESVMHEPLYHVLFILGVIIIFVALASRGMSREG